MEVLRQTVLRAKAMADAVPKARSLSNEVFMDVCTRAAMAAVNGWRGSGAVSDVVLQGHVTREVQAVVQSSTSAARTPSPGTGVSTPRTTRTTPRTTRGVVRASAAPAVAVDSVSAEGSQPLRVAILKQVKPFLDPLFRTRRLNREQYSSLALSLTSEFCSRFRSGGVGPKVLTATEAHWVQRAVDTRVGLVDTSGSSPASTTRPSAPTGPPRGSGTARRSASAGHMTVAISASTARPGGGSAGGKVAHGASPAPKKPFRGNHLTPPSFQAAHRTPSPTTLAGSPFAQQLEKIQSFVDQAVRRSERSASTHATAIRSPSAGPTAKVLVQTTKRQHVRREAVLKEVQAIQRQMAALSQELSVKLHQLHEIDIEELE